jgi:hypothetical protein
MHFFLWGSMKEDEDGMSDSGKYFYRSRFYHCNFIITRVCKLHTIITVITRTLFHLVLCLKYRSLFFTVSAWEYRDTFQHTNPLAARPVVGFHSASVCLASFVNFPVTLLSCWAVFCAWEMCDI